MAKIVDVEGIGPTYAAKLQEAGVRTTAALLDKGATPKGRKELAAFVGISGKLILRWVNHADLFRIKGIAGEYADLLEAAGVDTVPELSQRKGENLHAKMVKVNETKKLVRKVPDPKSIERWIAQAQKLPRKVSY
jgi:predicted flap endonuclease-1-like 5' DNA nuclease